MVDPRLIRDAGALGAAAAVVGASFGALAVAAGIGPWTAVAMSLAVFAGGSQFLAVGVVAAGGGAAAAVAGGLLLNARHLPFGLAVSDAVGRSWPMRLLGSHILVDETVAFATAQRGDPARARRAYWTAGLVLFCAWNLGTIAGVLAGQAVGDPAVFGVDAAFPAGLFALLLPSLRARDALRVGAAGAALALAATPVLPPGLPVLVALAALVVAGRAPARTPAQQAPAQQAPAQQAPAQQTAAQQTPGGSPVSPAAPCGQVVSGDVCSSRHRHSRGQRP
jgi:predicted branched-subunit amino acid permease